MNDRADRVAGGQPVAKARRRLRIAFFDYPDVFEDFYPHYGVDRERFATQWADTGNHAFVSLLQERVGDVTWYVQSLEGPAFSEWHRVVGCRVRFVPSATLHRRLWRAFYLPKCAWRWRSFWRPFATLASYLAPASLALWQALREDRPDCFFVQDYGSGRFDMLRLISAALGVPLVALHAGSHPDRYLGRLVRYWTLRQADAIVASSREELHRLARRFRVSPDRLEVILTPIDTAVYSPRDRSAACRAAGLDSSRRYLLFMGRLDNSVKRLDLQIDALACVASRHPDADLLIAGDGRDAPRVREWAESRCPGRVRFLGWVSDATKKANLYNAAECLLLPSMREGFPTVVGEALACGTPVIGSRVGGIPEVIEAGKTGWLVPPGDGTALARGVAEVLDDRNATASMRMCARSTALSRVAPRAVGDALARLVGRVCRERARRWR
ncbi:MAG: glycosyltransferase [Planctomycetes bacterium]|nr:glycosyltransferase [Planctomycetota bacterium]